MMYAKWVSDDGRFAFSEENNGGVTITKAHHQALLEGEYSGQRISPDEQGIPCLTDVPPPSQEQLCLQARQWRDIEIESVRWLRERHRDERESQRATTLTPAQFGELLDYIQALRDWPTSIGFPGDDSRPEKAGWIAQQLK